MARSKGRSTRVRARATTGLDINDREKQRLNNRRAGVPSAHKAAPLTQSLAVSAEALVFVALVLLFGAWLTGLA